MGPYTTSPLHYWEDSVWPLPLSIAFTYGIPVGFFSSAYYDASLGQVPVLNKKHNSRETIQSLIRKSPGQRLHAPNRSLSQLVTSFFSRKAETSTM